LQVFSFKLRGAFNKMAKLPREALERGVITSSAGNHAQGVALAAAKLVRLRAGSHGPAVMLVLPHSCREMAGAAAGQAGAAAEEALEVLLPCKLAPHGLTH
jgi:hypothetical protein